MPGRIAEFRICMPMSVDEFRIAHLWSVLEASRNETGGGEGLEFLANEPFSPNTSEYLPEEPLQAGGREFTEGQFTWKVLYFQSKVAAFIRALVPKESLVMEEKCWNAFPYVRTVITNPKYMKDNFFIVIETFYVENDTGQQENVHQLTREELGIREVHHIDIANNAAVARSDYREEWDPTKFYSKKSGRGPLPENTVIKGQQGGWVKTMQPMMCCYKLLRVYFKWMKLDSRIEKYILKQQKRLFTNMHRQLYCWMDKWYGLTLEDVRKMEEATKHELDELRKKGAARGMTSNKEAEEAEDGEKEKEKKRGGGCCCFRPPSTSASVHPS